MHHRSSLSTIELLQSAWRSTPYETLPSFAFHTQHWEGGRTTTIQSLAETVFRFFRR